MKCLTCDRKMRTQTDPPNPELVTLHRRGLCRTCYDKEMGLKRLKKSEKLPECMHCHKKMRPRKNTVSTFPGTVPGYGKKICWTCQQRINLPGVESTSTRPKVSQEEYLAVKRLVNNDQELLQVLGLDQFEEVDT